MERSLYRGGIASTNREAVQEAQRADACHDHEANIVALEDNESLDMELSIPSKASLTSGPLAILFDHTAYRSIRC